MYIMFRVRILKPCPSTYRMYQSHLAKSMSMDMRVILVLVLVLCISTTCVRASRAWIEPPQLPKTFQAKARIWIHGHSEPSLLLYHHDDLAGRYREDYYTLHEHRHRRYFTSISLLSEVIHTISYYAMLCHVVYSSLTVVCTIKLVVLAAPDVSHLPQTAEESASLCHGTSEEHTALGPGHAKCGLPWHGQSHTATSHALPTAHVFIACKCSGSRADFMPALETCV
jgi:hypothetical protein